MVSVLEEMTETTLSSEHVEHRLIDWEARIRALYREVNLWLSTDPQWMLRIEDNGVRLYEEPMRAVEIEPRFLPALDIQADGEPRARLEPRGLWIIGANGRLDLMVGRERFLIVDDAENFGRSKWVVMPALDRGSRSPLTQERFLSMIARRS